MADYKTILYQKQRSGVLITLNRPKALNAMNTEMLDELDRALARNDFSARRFAAFSRRQRKRFRTFRRFVIGFYTPQFRDLFFDPNPPKHMFRAIVTNSVRRSAGLSSSYWPAATRTKKLCITDWQMSMESKTR